MPSKPIHMVRRNDYSKTVCGIICPPRWVVPSDKELANVTCKLCLHGLKGGIDAAKEGK